MDIQKNSMVNTGHINTDPGCSMTLDLDMILKLKHGPYINLASSHNIDNRLWHDIRW